MTSFTHVSLLLALIAVSENVDGRRAARSFWGEQFSSWDPFGAISETPSVHVQMSTIPITLPSWVQTFQDRWRQALFPTPMLWPFGAESSSGSASLVPDAFQSTTSTSVPKRASPRGTKRRKAKGPKFGGRRALENEFPWRVYLESYFGARLMICAGAIIQKEWILTAAHCLLNYTNTEPSYATSVMVSAGSVHRKLGTQLWGNRWYIHNDYDYKSNNHDVALVRLPKSLNFSQSISAINLPASTYTGIPTELVASGWGQTENTSVSDVLMTAPARLVGINDQEHKFYTSAFPSSACMGDSGGSLDAQNEHGTWFAFGIVSHGSPECVSQTHPNVHTRISSYVSWIDETFEQDQLDHNSSNYSDSFRERSPTPEKIS